MIALLFPWVLYTLAWLFSLLALKHGGPLTENLLYYIVIFNGGLQGLWAALGHLAFTEQTAQKIGWQSNGFQFLYIV